MQQLIDTMSNKDAMKVINDLEARYKGLPHLPKGLVDFLVQIAPYASVISGIILLLSAVQSLTTNIDPELAAYIGYSNNQKYLMAIEYLILGGLALWSFSYLKARSMTGWLIMFWSVIIQIIFSFVIALMFGASAIVGAFISVVLMFLLSLYFLFEVKPHYSKTKHMVDKVAEDIKDNS